MCNRTELKGNNPRENTRAILKDASGKALGKQKEKLSHVKSDNFIWLCCAQVKATAVLLLIVTVSCMCSINQLKSTNTAFIFFLFRGMSFRNLERLQHRGVKLQVSIITKCNEPSPRNKGH